MDNYNIDDLIRKINELKAELKTAKKYGLVWDKEHTKEDVVIQCENNIPILSRDNSRTILNDGENNILIEGDNYHALTALNFIAKESIDIIYIDPPYNTGHKDFSYNDKFVFEDDGYKHSKWLSFMSKRLSLCRYLLRKNGLFIASIDSIELCQLKLLCDDIFGESNFISILPRKTVEHIRTNSNYELQNINDYVIVYSKSKQDAILTKEKVGENTYEYHDEFGNYTLKAFQNSGENGTREARPNLYYPIYYDLISGKLSLSQTNSSIEILPNKVKNKDGRWLWSKEKFERDSSLLEFKNNKIYRKVYYDVDADQSKYAAYKTWLDSYPNRHGALELKKLGLYGEFDYSKPVDLMMFLINLHSNKNACILDFFAGSGTTGQAVLELNKQDGGHRRFIMCTNNENNICTDVTYPRIKTVLTGIRPDGTKYSDGLPGNLYYFKTDFIKDEANTEQARYNLVEKVDSLLCIAENIFEEVERNDYSSHYASNDIHMFIYNDYFNATKFEEFKQRVLSEEGHKIVYIYSSDNTLDESLIVGNNIELKPIPSKIYEIYKEIVEEIKRDE